MLRLNLRKHAVLPLREGGKKKPGTCVPGFKERQRRDATGTAWGRMPQALVIMERGRG